MGARPLSDVWVRGRFIGRALSWYLAVKSTPPSPALRGSVFDLYRNCELPGVQAASLAGFDPTPGSNRATGVFGYDFSFLIFRDILADLPDTLEPPFTGHGYPLTRTLGAHRNFGGSHPSSPNFPVNCRLACCERPSNLTGSVNRCAVKTYIFIFRWRLRAPVMPAAVSSSCPRRRLAVMPGDIKHGVTGQTYGSQKNSRSDFIREVGEVAADESCVAGNGQVA